MIIISNHQISHFSSISEEAFLNESLIYVKKSIPDLVDHMSDAHLSEIIQDIYNSIKLHDIEECQHALILFVEMIRYGKNFIRHEGCIDLMSLLSNISRSAEDRVEDISRYLFGLYEFIGSVINES